MRHNEAIPQVLVQWQNMFLAEVTWEDVANLKVEFRDFNLEANIVVNGGSIDVNKRVEEKGTQEETRSS